MPGQLQLYLKNNSKKETRDDEGLVPHPHPTRRRLGRTLDNLSALWFGALVVCVWSFEKNWNSSEIGKMQSTGNHKLNKGVCLLPLHKPKGATPSLLNKRQKGFHGGVIFLFPHSPLCSWNDLVKSVSSKEAAIPLHRSQSQSPAGDPYWWNCD